MSSPYNKDCCCTHPLPERTNRSPRCKSCRKPRNAGTTSHTAHCTCLLLLPSRQIRTTCNLRTPCVLRGNCTAPCCQLARANCRKNRWSNLPGKRRGRTSMEHHRELRTKPCSTGIGSRIAHGIHALRSPTCQTERVCTRHTTCSLISGCTGQGCQPIP